MKKYFFVTSYKVMYLFICMLYTYISLSLSLSLSIYLSIYIYKVWSSEIISNILAKWMFFEYWLLVDFSENEQHYEHWYSNYLYANVDLSYSKKHILFFLKLRIRQILWQCYHNIIRHHNLMNHFIFIFVNFGDLIWWLIF